MTKPMAERDRLLKVLRRETPDRVPWFADLGHWYRAQVGRQWDLFTISNRTREIADLHREVRAGWYIEVGSLHEEYYEDGVVRSREIRDDIARETYSTRAGEITMLRKWNPVSCSWDVQKRLIETPGDLQVLLFATERRRFRPRYDYWDEMERIGGDVGLGFPSIGYTGLGALISYYMGVEETIYALCEEPELVSRFIAAHNAKQLEIVDICCAGPAPHIIFGDNLSSDVQSPPMFREHSFAQYAEIARRLHRAGKTVSAHLDGRLNGILEPVAQAGIDVADACTPAPTGDLAPTEIRAQAGNNMVLMGGIAPTMWLPRTSESDFVAHVRQWLDLRHTSSRLVQSAGDQVPPGTEISRIRLVHDIVEEHGRYQ
jgi:hypothetical protein